MVRRPPRSTLSLHDALPISFEARLRRELHGLSAALKRSVPFHSAAERRSEEHTSELQSRENLVCRLLLEKKKKLFNRFRKYREEGKFVSRLPQSALQMLGVF